MNTDEDIRRDIEAELRWDPDIGKQSLSYSDEITRPYNKSWRRQVEYVQLRDAVQS